MLKTRVSHLCQLKYRALGTSTNTTLPLCCRCRLALLAAVAIISISISISIDIDKLGPAHGRAHAVLDAVEGEEAVQLRQRGNGSAKLFAVFVDALQDVCEEGAQALADGLFRLEEAGNELHAFGTVVSLEVLHQNQQ